MNQRTQTASFIASKITSIENRERKCSVDAQKHFEHAIGFTYEEMKRLTSKRLKGALFIDGEIYVHPPEFEFLYDIDDILITQSQI